MLIKHPKINSLIYTISFLFFFLTFFLFKLQVIQGEKFQRIARENYVRIKTQTPVRGEIYDRKYRPIAINKPSYNLYIIPGKIKNTENVINFVAGEFDFSKKSVREIIHKNRFRLYHEIPLKQNVDYQKLLKISERLNYYPSLFFKAENLREFLYKNHFTGYVGRISDKEYSSSKNKGYSINSSIGKSGIEKYYEDILSGENGYEILQVDANGNNLQFFKHNLKKQALNGKNLILSIDNDLQQFIDSIFPDKGRGCVIVSEVQTGEILAYISKPSFDQNIFSNNLGEEEWAEFLSDPAKPMLDRIIHGTYPPGSVYKPVIACLGLETKTIGENTKMANCTGGMQFGNKFVKCWWEGGHGRLNIIDAMKFSCDVFFYDLSTHFTLEQIDQYTKQNLMTIRTGIDIPGERKGFFPTAEWYLDNYGKFLGTIGHKVNLSIGQGELLVTPLQICSYYAALGNNGVWIQPHFLSKIVEEDYLLTRKYNHFQLPVSDENLQLIKRSLFKAVNEQYGTGTSASVRNVRVYGKTGSAENHMGEKTHAWFAGFAEWEKPEIAFTVFIENAGHGGSVAAPIAGKIVRFYGEKLKQNKDKY